MHKFFTALFFVLAYHSLVFAQGFVENKGQWKEPFLYKTDIAGGSLFLDRDALTFHIVDRSEMHAFHDNRTTVNQALIDHHHAFRIQFEGCNANAVVTSSEPLNYYYNYFIGNHSANWQSKIYPVQNVKYNGLYDGIDLIVMRRDMRMKYEFHVAPGHDYKEIKLSTVGLNELKLDRDGNLLMSTNIMDIMESKPIVYQLKGERKLIRDAAFVINGNEITYSISDYDSTLATVIDPEIIFSTYSGSSSDNWGFTATPDGSGFLYGGSIAFGTGYPTTTGAYDTGFNDGEIDITISKFNTSGTDLIFSTYLGGEENDFPHSMIIDANDNLYVFGTTGSSNFPTTTNAFDTSFNGTGTLAMPILGAGGEFSDGCDFFVSRFSADGANLVGSTFIGGTGRDGINNATELQYNYADELRGEINIDQRGDVYLVSCTNTNNFPGTSGSFQSSKSGLQDAIIIKLNPLLSSILWSSYLGGSGNDAAYGIDIAKDGSIYVCGGTASSNFPTRSGAFQGTYGQGRSDGFISHISSDGKTLLHSTFLGSGQYDQMYLIQLDKDDQPHVFGQTENAGSHFIFNAGFNNLGGGQVLAKFRTDLGSRTWSTQFGSTAGRPNISPTSFLVDLCKSVYIAGWGGNTNTFGNNNASSVMGLPVTTDAFQSTPDNSGSDFYLAALSADANTLIFGSFYGGNESDEHVDGGTSRFDRSGKVYQAVCAGCGGNDDFPIEPDPGAWSEVNGNTQNDNCNSAFFKVDFQLPIIIADFDIPDFACAPAVITFENNSLAQTATTYFWQISNGVFFNSTSPTYTFNSVGTFTVTLIVSDPNSCNLHDTLTKTITIKTDTLFSLPEVFACVGETVQIGIHPDSIDYTRYTFTWNPASLLNNPNLLNPTTSLNNTTIFRLTIDYDGCAEIITQQVTVDRYPISAGEDTIVCSNFSAFQVTGTAYGQAPIFEWSRNANFNPIFSTDSIITVSNLNDPLNYFYLRTTKANGCQMMDTFLVTVSDYDFYLTNDTMVCKNDELRIEAKSSNALNTFYYFWTLAPLSSNPDSPLLTDSTINFLLVNNAENVTYYVYAKSRKVDGCNVSDSISITVSQLDKLSVNASASTDTFYFGQSVQLVGTPSIGFEYHWEPGTYLNDSTLSNPIARPKESMQYIYYVSDKDLPICAYSDTVYLRQFEIVCGEPEVFLPNAFSPNEDGVNDLLKLEGRNLMSVDLSIYDRWGTLMFQTLNKNEGWDGNFNGLPVERAVYNYYYEATCIDGQFIFRKGNITVLK